MIVQQHFDEFDIGNRYGLDYACYWLCREQPSSIRLCTEQVDVVMAAATRLVRPGVTFHVETNTIATVLKSQLGAQAKIQPHQKTDAALVLYARDNYPQPPHAKRVVILAHNRLSYKSVLYPRLAEDQVWRVQQWLKISYQIDGRAGLFTPRFLRRWIGAMLAGSRCSELHFQRGQRAMDSLINVGPFWWLGYVVVLAGKENTR